MKSFRNLSVTNGMTNNQILWFTFHLFTERDHLNSCFLLQFIEREYLKLNIFIFFIRVMKFYKFLWNHSYACFFVKYGEIMWMLKSMLM